MKTTDTALILVGYQNDTFTRMFGYHVKEFHDGLHPAVLYADHGVAKDVFATIMNGGSCEREIEMVAKDGRCFPVHLRADAVKNDEGEIIGLIGIHRDITERKQAEMQLDQHVATLESMNRALAESNERAEAATRAKSEFLANVSHEIRTPITAIMGFADLLSDSEGRSPKDAAWAQRILQNADHLRRLLDDVLDLAKIEAGRMKVEREACNLKQIIDDVAAAFREDANAKHLEFSVQHGARVPKFVVGDRTRIMQVLVNLVSNAMKFTSQGNVTINTTVVPADEERHEPSEVRIGVADTGVGMTSDQIEQLFSPFQRLHDLGSSVSGTGLGLAISNRLVGSMGGRIEVESEPEKGSRFTVVLRVDRVTGMPSDPDQRALASQFAPQVAFPGLRVLLVEDNVDNEEVLVHMLQPAGVHLTVARNGAEAIEEVAQQQASGLGFDLILMDMQMPVMDGFETTAVLRRKGIRVPIIAITAYAMAHQRQGCLNAGCDACLPKPVVRQDLYTAMAQAIDSCAIAQESADLVTPLSATGSCQGGDARFVEILTRYVTSLRQHLKAIHAAESAGDAEEIRKIAHRLKGTAANYGFPAITETAGLCHDRLHEGAS